LSDPLTSITDPDRRAALAPYLAWTSLADMAYDRMSRYGAKPFLWAKHNGAYESQSFTQVAEAAANCAYGLAGLGIVPGDRVALVAENRPE
jgi:long-chain acyl-CoA synthetase